jgi:hypothetical protein
VRDDESMRPRVFVARGFGLAATVGVVLSAGFAGCSSADDDPDSADDEGPTTTAVVVGPSDSVRDAVGAPGSDPTAVTSESLATIPAVGVPGLDSDEVVCRAWSRFAGSFQVVSVAASFGSGDAEDVAGLEVIAAPTVTAAYDDLIANWPAELAEEADAVADDYLGPFARRADRALAALQSAGADATTIDAIVAAWETALAGRDPSEPEIVVELPDTVQTIVDAAASELAAQLVPIPSDPSLVIAVDVPLTDQYLADNCPDRGTLGGVDG